MYNLAVVKTYKPANAITKTIDPVEQGSISILSAAKFTRFLKCDDKVYMLLLEQLDGDLHFIYCVVYGDTIKKKMTSSE